MWRGIAIKENLLTNVTFIQSINTNCQFGKEKEEEQVKSRFELKHDLYAQLL